MRQRAKTAVAAVAVTGLAVVGLDTYTYAATGDSLILGKLNTAGNTTTVTNNGNGPALSLHAKGNAPALAVDSGAKIVHLNADTVDGKSAAGLQTHSRVFVSYEGVSENGEIAFQLSTFPTGSYLATYEVAMVGAYGSVTHPTTGTCRLVFSGDANATTSSTSVGQQIALSGSTVIRNPSVDDDWYLICSTFEAPNGFKEWQVDSETPVRVTLTRIDQTVQGDLTPQS